MCLDHLFFFLRLASFDIPRFRAVFKKKLWRKQWHNLKTLLLKSQIQTYRSTCSFGGSSVFNLSFLRCGLVDFVTSSCRLKALQMLGWDTGLLNCRLCFHFFFLPTDLFFFFSYSPKQGSAFVSTRERKGWPCMSTVSFDLWYIVFFLFFSCLVCGEGEGSVGFLHP